MNREKRGGAHLAKNLSPKKTAPHSEASAPASGMADKTSQPGLSRKKKRILIVALVLAGLALLGGLIGWVVGDLFADDGLLGGLPTVPAYDDGTGLGGELGPIRSEADSKR